MSTELTTRSTPAPMALNDKMEYAKAMASASLLPRAYQQQPGNVLLAMEMGDALGIPPIQAINDIHVIEGKPSASANLIGALVRKAGHKLRVSGDDATATAQVIRADDPDFTFEVTWTLARAQQAGLVKAKGNWEKYPAAMLKARAITEVARAACPDALYGVIYTPEELGAVVTEDGDPVQGANPAPRPQVQRPAPPTLGEAMNRPAPAAPQAPMISRDQWEQIAAALAANGYDTFDAQLQAAGELLDVRLSAPQEMTAAQAEQVLTELTAPTEGPSADAVTGELIDEPSAA